MSQGKSEQSCPCWNCMAENHVKGSLLVEIPFYSLDIKATFLSLKVKKGTTKIRLTFLGRSHEVKSKVVLQTSVW